MLRKESPFHLSETTMQYMLLIYDNENPGRPSARPMPAR